MSSNRAQLLPQAPQQRDGTVTGWHAPQRYTSRRSFRRDEIGQILRQGEIGRVNRRREPGGSRGLAAYLNTHLLQVALAVVMALAFGFLVALILGDWRLFPVAAGIHGLATSTGAFTVRRMSHRRSPRSLTRTRPLI